ncbi:voltage-dependent calcium channel subunit alpha-2/delta-3 [Aplysia californica]|uniref:Voltage-dependent calcium channel subunit alpha-2/delta-3 n=1 Tax=Aplysia californica TaxID=6500 RepID=A0ABM0ZXJ7_APLCA|nr:voltage-dependent calcium channel subunit alpha-2/delta-3 [Aplysia californica]
MQWPRDADDVDTFDCRIRKWYIQAATSPKNILILLDSSGSMKGLRFSIARSTVTKILETLSDEDYFNVIEFSEEPKYVDECFQDTLMPASVDNIRRMQEKIDGLEASKYANFEKALTRAFKLFQKEQFQYSEQCLCNKAIMIITDGAPENYESVFDRFNWPEKAIRVFTFLIGKEVPDNRQTRWMACANKGKFAHISTRADVQENVQKYIKVLSRPLAIQRALHKVWSPVYLDYVTDHSDIKVPRNAPASLDVDYEQSATYEGLGLVMSISMPVFDERTDVGPKEEEPERNLLGVVGTDVRINELMKLIPTYKLGVNGYAFAITNHGYILFHPDYRPFYAEKFKAEQRLKKRPKYNSVEFSEVELPVSAGTGWNKEHPLRQYLLTLKSGGQSMYSVLTHTDGMRRAKERRNKYRFREVADTFKLVFVVPDKYGLLEVKVDSGVPTLKQILEMGRDVEVGTDISKWVYCYGKTSKTYSQLNILKFTQYVEQGTLYKMCSNNDNYDFVNRTLKDFEWTLDYVNVWNGVVNGLLDPGEPKYVTDYRKCYSNAISKKESFKKMMCFYRTHMSHGIGTIWIGTSSGLTRHIMLNDITMNWMDFNLETIKSTYYKRAVDGHEDGYKYVFTGPVITSQSEYLTLPAPAIVVHSLTPVQANTAVFQKKRLTF